MVTRVPLRSQPEHCSSARENPLLASSVRMELSRSEILQFIAISAQHWRSPKVCRNRIRSSRVPRLALWMAPSLPLPTRYDALKNDLEAGMQFANQQSFADR